MAETASIREQCISRSRGRCENPLCRKHLGGIGVLDHWLGGNGRRTQEQSVETCWILCADCNSDRTLNLPDAVSWNRRFELHCLVHGYDFTPHYVNETAPL